MLVAVRRTMYKTLSEIQKRETGMIEFQKRTSSRVRNFTHDERVLAGAMRRFDTTRNVAEALGIHHETARLAGKGILGDKTLDTKLRDDVDAIEKTTKEEVRDVAMDRLMSALGIVDSTLPNVTKALDASVIAKNMANIVNSMEGGGVNANFTGVKIVIETTAQKNESDYETITV